MFKKIKSFFIPRTINGIDMKIKKVNGEDVSFVLFLRKSDGSVEDRELEASEGDTVSLN